jgi:hypothetical protein
MINPSEITRGSVVEFNDQHCMIHEITENGVLVRPLDGTGFTYTEYDTINPIPITPKLLSSSGFIKDGDVFHIDNWLICINPADDTDYWVLGFDTGVRRPVNFHSLQNMYFADTSKDLIVV